MTRRRLPIGIQTFRRIREDGCYYVDATAVPKIRVDGRCEDVIFFDGVFFGPSLTSVFFAT